ncbi:MAG TPA: SHOCT domain-containing protein [Burkholderiales bacterium]|nr:SHOCT domain-containing protein [Burkholderiales bacterium]
MWIFPLIFLVVLVLFLFRGPGWPICGGHRSQDREENAREILDRRYARGEISREEYHRMRKDLK